MLTVKRDREFYWPFVLSSSVLEMFVITSPFSSGRIMKVFDKIKRYREFTISLCLSSALHLAVIAAVVFFPPVFISDEDMSGNPSEVADLAAGEARKSPGRETSRSPSQTGMPVSFSNLFRTQPHIPAHLFGLSTVPSPAQTDIISHNSSSHPPRLLNARPRMARLTPPDFAADTIPSRPRKSMWQEVRDRGDEYLGGDVYREGVPLHGDPTKVFREEAAFVAELEADLEDGWLDMDFVDFILPAEYYRLYRALVNENRQPAFTLKQARQRFAEKLKKIGADLPEELDALALVMILQRYAEDKYYPENGSGMLLDSLYHNIADCESGSIEIISYLDILYPGLSLGTNRGLIPTTDGRLIGHMQVYLSADQRTRNIMQNRDGLVVEATRVDRESIMAWDGGDRYPLEDFVYRFYPGLHPAEKYRDGKENQDPGHKKEVVGASNHPMKMDYELPSSIIGDRPLDLALLHRQKIRNGFQKSHLPSCDPGVDPEKVDRSNLFSNLVTIDPKLRKSLVTHYLAKLDYWDNLVMPSWQLPDFLSTYRDLAATLAGESEGEIVLDSGEILDPASVVDHSALLKHLATREEAARKVVKRAPATMCRSGLVLDGDLLSYLFERPEEPGVFLLHEPDQSVSELQTALLNNCLIAPENSGDRIAWKSVVTLAEQQGVSFRKRMFEQLTALAGGDDTVLNQRLDGLRDLFQGVKPRAAGDGRQGTLEEQLGGRRSESSTIFDPSVAETLSLAGASGINSGLLKDSAIFFAPEELRSLLAQFLRRDELKMDLNRAAGFADILAEVTAGMQDERGGNWLLDLAGESSNPEISLALTVGGARLAGESRSVLSRMVADYLSKRERIDLSTLRSLQGYGLSREDGLQVLNIRFREGLEQLPPLEARGGRALTDQYSELVELVAGINFLGGENSSGVRELLLSGITERLVQLRIYGMAADSVPADYSPLLSRLLLLSRLKLSDSGGEKTKTSTLLETRYLEAFLLFAKRSSFGRMLTDLVASTIPQEMLDSFIEDHTRQQNQLLSALSVRNPAQKELGAKLAGVIGESNVIYRFLRNTSRQEGDQYLLNLHRRVAAILTPATENSSDESNIPLGFYVDQGVRESFSLLGSLAVQMDSGNGAAVKFRTIKDLRTIKDMTKVKVIEDTRKVTRQDMSLLTLALNPANGSEAIARSWQETVGVIAGHRELVAEDSSLKRYLFTPNAPYLLENDFGFFYTPGLIADLPNAAEWGAKNDILLSSYLHFRNMVAELPGWLLEAATKRSDFERKMMKKLRTTTFLPMILECTEDAEVMPDPLFRAKWTIRKPFGEDIMPATLLLVRLGYMDFTDEGELVLTDKYRKRYN